MPSATGPAIDETVLKDAMWAECRKENAIKTGFAVNRNGWTANFTGCDGAACSDVLGKPDQDGNDWHDLIGACTGHFPGWKPGQPYVLTVSPDGVFHGGLFEHVSQGKSCGVLTIQAD